MQSRPVLAILALRGLALACLDVNLYPNCCRVTVCGGPRVTLERNDDELSLRARWMEVAASLRPLI